MKIVILSDDFPPYHKGGAGVIAEILAKGLSGKGYTVSVITTTEDKSLVGQKTVDGISIYTLYSSYKMRWRSYITLYNPFVLGEFKSLLKSLEPDVVHIHNVHMHLSYGAMKIARRISSKVFFTAHDAMTFHYGKLTLDFMGHEVSPWQQFKIYKKEYNPFRNIVIKHYLKYVDKIFAVSSALKDALVQNGIGNVEVVHNGIKVDEFNYAEDVDVIKEKYGLKNKKVVLFAGRLSTQKGGKVIVDAIAKVATAVPNVSLLIAGKKDDQAEKMSLYAGSLGIQERLVFTGWLGSKEMKSVYKVSDVVAVLSTYLDPFPTINLEAMASGCPVLGTSFGGTPEAVEDGVTGFIVDPRDSDVCAEKIIKLLGDMELSQSFGYAGVVRVKKYFSEEVYVDETDKWYLKTN